MPPKPGSTDFKELFLFAAASGTGKAVNEYESVSVPWTPEELSLALATADDGGKGLELRTVQFWFQENERTISDDGLNLVAKVFGCGDEEAARDWRHALMTARQVQKARRRKASRTKLSSAPGRDGEPGQDESQSSPKIAAGLAKWTVEAFSAKGSLGQLIIAWGGYAVLGILHFALGVHDVTYNPVDGLEKQVGFVWAPTWTLLPLIVLPALIFSTSKAITLWRESTLPGSPSKTPAKILLFRIGFLIIPIICFLVVFVLQWVGIYLQIYLSGDTHGIQIDRNLIAIVRPEVISPGASMMISALGYLYTAWYIWVFLVGLLFFYIIADDFYEIKGNVAKLNCGERSKIASCGKKLISSIFVCCVLGLWIAICIRVQAVYLLTDHETIMIWLWEDALAFLGSSEHGGGWLDQRAVPVFTTTLMMMISGTIFLISVVKIRCVVRETEGLAAEALAPRISALELVKGCIRSDYFSMVAVVGILSIVIAFAGLFEDFSLVLCFASIASIYSIYAHGLTARATSMEDI